MCSPDRPQPEEQDSPRPSRPIAGCFVLLLWSAATVLVLAWLGSIAAKFLGDLGIADHADADTGSRRVLIAGFALAAVLVSIAAILVLKRLVRRPPRS
jgi:hypothetical protein